MNSKLCRLNGLLVESAVRPTAAGGAPRHLPCGPPNGALERGGVEVDGAGGRESELIVREKEGERNSMLFKWKSRAHRGEKRRRLWRLKGTRATTTKNTPKNGRHVYFAHGESHATS